MSGHVDNSPFQPPFWLPEGQSQTIIGARFARHPRIQFERERLNTDDGDFIDLDWNIPGLHELNTQFARHKSQDTITPDPVNPTEPLSIQAQAPLQAISTENSPQEPTQLTHPEFTGQALVLFHGLEGSSESHYAQSICHDFRQLGWAVVVAHFRGCSGENNRLPRSYFSGDTRDVAYIMHNIQRRLPNAQWYAAGISMGGNVLLKYAGEQGSSLKHLKSIAAISAPTDLHACAVQLGQGFFSKQIYTPYFLIGMKKKMREKHQQWGHEIPLQKILSAQTIFEFDDAYTGPIHGFAGAADYYQRCSSQPGLANIQVPCLVLNAKNDPFVPAFSLPKASEVSSYVTLHQPEHGGQVGISQGRFPSKHGWMSQRLLKFFKGR